MDVAFGFGGLGAGERQSAEELVMRYFRVGHADNPLQGAQLTVLGRVTLSEVAFADVEHHDACASGDGLFDRSAAVVQSLPAGASQ